ncbi:MAG: aromatic-ring-hydroxylating dioxygenase subunit beta [Pseudomonadota bacterium]|nr:aromatic-ring-hydroxylating dioxygenase subunit beta [Pseudomonadota bacterium]
MSKLDDLILIRAVEEFLFFEARLLDGREFQAWAELFADDGIYWVPMREGQEDPLTEHSIFYDDKDLLDVRVRRLLHPDTLAQIPASRTRHVVGNVVLDETDGDEIHARSNLVMFEYRRDEQRVFGAEVQHRLHRVEDGFEIVLRRVDLVNCEAVHGYMSVPF